MTTDREATLAKLSAPFPPEMVDCKPQAIKGNRAMVVWYVDARAVMDRLDSVLGIGNWQTSHREAADGSVICRLRVRIDGEWCEHEDVGSPSEQPDSGDRTKAAFSDSLKRVAIRVSVGRYLYDLPATWADYDPQKRAFVQTPKLPAWALPPKGGQPPRATPEPRRPAAKAAPAEPDVVTLPELIAEVARAEGRPTGDVVDDLLAKLGKGDNAVLGDLTDAELRKAARWCAAHAAAAGKAAAPS